MELPSGRRSADGVTLRRSRPLRDLDTKVKFELAERGVVVDRGVVPATHDRRGLELRAVRVGLKHGEERLVRVEVVQGLEPRRQRRLVKMKQDYGPCASSFRTWQPSG